MGYTTFEYSSLSITQVPAEGGDTASAQAWDSGSASPRVEGVSTAAW
jgi:hypothetical protein